MRCAADDAGQWPRSMVGNSLSGVRPHAVRWRPKFAASDARSTRTKPGRAAALNRAIASGSVAATAAPSPAGTLSEEQWTAAYRAVVAKPSVEAYEPLFRDIAVTAGMAGLTAEWW